MRYFFSIKSSLVVLYCMYVSFLCGESVMHQLDSAPEHIETFKEIAVTYDEKLPAALNGLQSAERVFVYYLFRASLPGNRICTDQMHKDGLTVQHIFQTIFDHEATLLARSKQKNSALGALNVPKFMQEVKTYLVYLWANHGQYFEREHADEKRTPARLGLHLLSKEHITKVLTVLDEKGLAEQVEELAAVIFDHTYQPTGTVPNSIEKSARNFYAPGFTERDYQALPIESRAALNTYGTLETTRDGIKMPRVVPYAVHGKYGQELAVSAYWLQKAYEHAAKHPALFDEHLIKSLEYIIVFVQTGDEEYFKKHSIEWLKTKSNVDYCFGFIETYDDPKNQRGSFQAEATVRTITLDSLSAILPSIEKQLPVDTAFKRDLSAKDVALPNASINTKIFGTGHLGPVKNTAAYCLPNYEEIRAAYGSKQVIYPSGKGLGAMINPYLSRRLFFTKAQADWLDEHDQDRTFLHDLWDVHCILHETLGHGSGRLAYHTCTAEELQMRHDTAHKVGDVIPVTSDNLADFLVGYDAAIEELRAEIIALYVSITHLSELVERGLLTDWYNRIGRVKLEKWLMYHMLETGLMRWQLQQDSSTEISGDHARANVTITNYVIEAGGARIVEEQFEHEGKEYTVIALEVTDMTKAMKAVEKLLAEVQRIKSTGDGVAAKKLIETYGIPIKNMNQFRQLRANNKTVVGDLKCKVDIYPHLEPVRNEAGEIVDISATWPINIFEQWKEFNRLVLSVT